MQIGYWHEPDRSRAKRRWSLGLQRLGEVERLIQSRYGGPNDCDDGWPYACIAINSFPGIATGERASGAERIGELRQRLHSWCAVWIPRLTPWEVERLISDAINRPRNFTADKAAWMLKITMSERMSLRITTIGAIDCNKEQRGTAKKARHRERQRQRDTEKRRAQQKPTRKEYVDSSTAALCRTLGMSRSKYYALKKAGRAPAAEFEQVRAGEIGTAGTMLPPSHTSVNTLSAPHNHMEDVGVQSTYPNFEELFGREPRKATIFEMDGKDGPFVIVKTWGEIDLVRRPDLTTEHDGRLLKPAPKPSAGHRAFTVQSCGHFGRPFQQASGGNFSVSS